MLGMVIGADPPCPRWPGGRGWRIHLAPSSLVATPTLARSRIRDKLDQPQPSDGLRGWGQSFASDLDTVGEARSFYPDRRSSSDVCLLRSIANCSGSLGAGGQNLLGDVAADLL